MKSHFTFSVINVPYVWIQYKIRKLRRNAAFLNLALLRQRHLMLQCRGFVKCEYKKKQSVQNGSIYKFMLKENIQQQNKVYTLQAYSLCIEQSALYGFRFVERNSITCNSDFQPLCRCRIKSRLFWRDALPLFIFDDFLNFSSQLTALHPAEDKTVRMRIPDTIVVCVAAEFPNSKSGTSRYYLLCIPVLLCQQVYSVANNNSDIKTPNYVIQSSLIVTET